MRQITVQKVDIVWFKRDLRVQDHAPLEAASQTGNSVLPLYVVEDDYWAQPFASERHWLFLEACLIELRKDCAALGMPLVVRIGDVCAVLADLQKQFDLQSIYAHEETGNGWTYERDKRVLNWCRDNKILFHEFPSNGVVRRLTNRDKWSFERNRRMAQEMTPMPKALRPVDGIDPGVIPDVKNVFQDPGISREVQQGGRSAGQDVLTSFVDSRVSQYLKCLSAPGLSEQYASRLSPHLTWGTLSVREVVKTLSHYKNNADPRVLTGSRRSLSAFQSRLSWRCHFIQKLEDQPSIETKCMHDFFEGLRESEHNQDYYDAWKNGMTGYPFIDACMRNLNHNGWITFRMRAMLVSFASYNLWLDWRKTGYHLAQVFTDYEPGIHYSQLQMQSGVTGINTVRIYNPVKQSMDHDPSGAFIRRWVPELQEVGSDWIHEPWKMDAGQQQKVQVKIGDTYPAPLTEHASAVKLARAKMAEVFRREGFRQTSKVVYEKLGSRRRQSKRSGRHSKVKQEEKPKAQLSFFD
ncbi:MAG: FAD-binding domain-containing protein [Candidatus Micropelagos thuwalensis]